MKKKKIYICDFTDPFPPFILYAIARKRMPDGSWRRGMNYDEIAEASGLAVRTCARVASKLTWAGDKQSVIDAFCKGCGFSFFNVKRQKSYINQALSRNTLFAHLSGQRRAGLEKRFREFLEFKGNKSE
jgi:hypothetical protein